MNTYSYSYTHTRIEILEFHFELFLRSAGMNDKEVEKLLDSVEKHELIAVGIYIEENGYKAAEVEISVDWDLHKEMVKTSGEHFSDDIPGWKNGVAPEAYVAVQRLVRYAKNSNKRVQSWIRVSPEVRKNPDQHKAVCDKLGYAYGRSTPKWKNEPVDTSLKVNHLEEVTITRRFSPYS